MRLTMVSTVPRKVIKKFERVVSTKILQSDYDRIMGSIKDLHSKKKIAQPTVSAFLRYLLSPFLEHEQPNQTRHMDLIRFLPDGTITIRPDLAGT
jgi:hypothetical protein